MYHKSDGLNDLALVQSNKKQGAIRYEFEIRREKKDVFVFVFAGRSARRIAGRCRRHLVGLADTAIKESLLRTITALQSMGFRIPGRKIVINLAPADMHKKGSGYDVPIALGIIAASGQRAMPALACRA